MSTLVSVIIPNYNHAQFLEQRIESVLNQTYSNIEVIILDDCSTDQSLEIIEKYSKSDSRIRVILNEKNSGSPFKQWKKGIDNARGELVWIAESDDHCDNNMLECLLEFFDKNSATGIAYAMSIFVDEQGNKFGSHLDNLRQLHPTLWETDFETDGKTVMSQYMPIINVIPNASAVLFNKDIAKRVNWDKLLSYRLAGDRYFWIQILSECGIAYTVKAVNYFRFSTTTVRASVGNTLKYTDEIISVISEISKRADIPVKVRKLALRQWLRHAEKATAVTNKFYFLTKTKLMIQFLTLIFIMFCKPKPNGRL